MSVKQRINLKFLVCLGKIPTEALKLLLEIYGDDTMSRTLFLSGTGGSKRRWKMITGMGGHPQKNRRKCSACKRKGEEQSPSYC